MAGNAPFGAAGRRGAGRHSAVAALTAVLGLLAVPGGAASQTMPADLAFLPTCVQINSELAGHLRAAADALSRQRYDRGLEILKVLLETGDRSFYRCADDPRRFLSLPAAVNDILSTLGPEAIGEFRNRRETVAAALVAKASQTGDVPLLRRVVLEYYHTAAGAAATNRLGEVRFDRARFIEAADLWETLSGRPAAGGSRPMLLAKAAVAAHVGGMPRRAAQLLRTLQADHPDAAGTIAGREGNLAAYVADALRRMPVLAADRVPHVRDWASYAGSPGGIALMPSFDGPPKLRWCSPAKDNVRRAHAVAGIVGWLAISEDRTILQRFVAELDGGWPTLSIKDRSAPAGSVSPPPVVHPAVVGDLVLLREYEFVKAFDLRTGKLRWSTLKAPLSLQRDWFKLYGQWGALMGDTGRQILTVDGDRAYTVCKYFHYLPKPPRTAQMIRQGTYDRDTSALVALSLRDDGRIIWEIGNSDGDREEVAQGRFLAPPTCWAGRLYTLLSYEEAYYTVCIDPDTRRTCWLTELGPTPGPGLRYGGAWRYAAQRVVYAGTPPAVADGAVYAATNAGMVAALDADSGYPMWAHEYPTRGHAVLNTAAFMHSMQAVKDRLPFFPPNPVITDGRRVICLPADAESVIALKATTGRLLWEVARLGREDLTALDAEHVLLSGPGLIVIRSRDGRIIARTKGVDDVRGRPAVTPDAVYASGRGRIVRLDRKTWRVTAYEIPADKALLGRLISTGDKLIAANLSGVCVYDVTPAASD